MLAIFAATLVLLISVQPTTTTTHSALDDIGTIFRDIGFSPTCVSKTLSQCENTLSQQSISLDLSSKLHKLIETTLASTEKNKRPKNCFELYKDGDTESGIRVIYPYTCCQSHSVYVYCDQTSDGRGWTVFQRRENFPEREDFTRKWAQYQIGFGDLNREFWLGLNNLHALVKDAQMELRVDLEDYDGDKRWAKYGHFSITGPEDNYRLSTGDYSGTAGDSFTEQSGQAFSTQDKDNDIYDENCAVKYKGAWWYTTERTRWYPMCYFSNLNGYQYEVNQTSFADGINWIGFRGAQHSMKKTSMKIRPKFRY